MELKFVNIPFEFIKRNDLNANEKLLAGFISTVCEMELKCCIMTNDTIAEELQISKRTLSRCLSKLEDLNIIYYQGSNNSRRIFVQKNGQVVNNAQQNVTTHMDKLSTESDKVSTCDDNMAQQSGQSGTHNKVFNKEVNKVFNKELKKSKPKKEIDVYSSEIKFLTSPQNALQIFNYAFDTNYKTLNSVTYETLQLFTKEEFATVCKNASNDDFWKDKATPNNIFKLNNFEKLLNAKEQEKTTADLNIGWKGII